MLVIWGETGKADAVTNNQRPIASRQLTIKSCFQGIELHATPALPWSMKNRTIVSIVLVTVCGAFMVADPIIEKLGMQQEAARASILKNFVGRFATSPIDDGDLLADEDEYRETKAFQIPPARLLKDVIAGDRTAAAQELCAYVKNYVNSAEFRDAYAKLREGAKPTSEPVRMGADEIASLKEASKEMEKQYEALKASGQLPAASLEQFKVQINQARSQIQAQVAAQSDPTPNATRWNKLYPEDPRVMIKARLNEYLQLLPTVDFNAQVKTVGSKKKFVNPAYEQKSLRWKAIYRAGKDVNDVAAKFAKEWLQE